MFSYGYDYGSLSLVHLLSLFLAHSIDRSFYWIKVLLVGFNQEYEARGPYPMG